MISLKTVPIPNPNIIGRVVDGEAVLVLPEQGKVKVLNEVGAAIWELVDGERSIQAIVAEICQEFEVDENTVQEDTLVFMGELIEREIVTLSNG